MNAALDATAHLDGYRMVAVRANGRLMLFREFWAGGARHPEVARACLSDVPEEDPNSEAAHEAAFLLFNALCQYVNLVGDSSSLRRAVDEFIESGVREIVPRHQLVSVIPLDTALEVIWKRKDGKYLRVKTGDEGFVDEMDETDLLKALGREEKPADEELPPF